MAKESNLNNSLKFNQRDAFLPRSAWQGPEPQLLVLLPLKGHCKDGAGTAVAGDTLFVTAAVARPAGDVLALAGLNCQAGAIAMAKPCRKATQSVAGHEQQERSSASFCCEAGPAQH